MSSRRARAKKRTRRLRPIDPERPDDLLLLAQVFAQMEPDELSEKGCFTASGEPVFTHTPGTVN